MIEKQRLYRLLMVMVLVAGAVLILTALSEENLGTPSKRTDQSNCGITAAGCHEADRDDTLGIYTTPETEDHHLFATSLNHDGDKVGKDDYKVQAKAVAVDGHSDFIHSLDDTDNEGKLDLTIYGPAEGEKFWVGFGYKDNDDIRHINVQSDAYTYNKRNEIPVPALNISTETDFPEDDELSLRLEGEGTGEVFRAYLSREGSVTVYMEVASYDPDTGDELSHYWDLNENGNYGEGGETEASYEFTYTETGSHEFRYRTADGKDESGSIVFQVEVKETRKKPELHFTDFTIADRNWVPTQVFLQNDLVNITFRIENNDDVKFNKGTEGTVKSMLYYSLDSEDFATWYEVMEFESKFPLGEKEIYYTSRNWNTEGLKPDIYRIKMVADYEDEVKEWNETNNVAFGEFELKEKLYPDYDGSKNPSSICLTDESQSDPVVQGNIIVWQDRSYGEWDILMFDLDNDDEITMISNMSSAITMSPYELHMHTAPLISGTKIIWIYEWNDFFVHERYFVEYDLENPVPGGTILCEVDDLPLSVSFSGDWIVWMDLADDGDLFDPFALYTYNIQSRQQEKLMNFGGDYALQGDKLLYFDSPTTQIIGEETSFLKILNLTTGELETNLTISGKLVDISNPNFNGNYVVWEDGRLDESNWLEDGNTDIYCVNLKDETIAQITTNMSTQERPKIDGDTILWTDKRSGKSGVRAYSITENKFAVLVENDTSNTEPDISGNLVVWTNSFTFGEDNIYVYELDKADWTAGSVAFTKLEDDGTGDPGGNDPGDKPGDEDDDDDSPGFDLLLLALATVLALGWRRRNLV